LLFHQKEQPLHFFWVWGFKVSQTLKHIILL